MAKKMKHGLEMPRLTKAKGIRLLIFAALTALGFVLAARVPAFSSFGWGYTFGMAAMAALTG